MRSARLVGHQHHTLDAVAAITEGPAGITICRGGARKTYSYTDPNEDAVCFAFGPQGALVAVADGHHGARGAERAIEWLLANRAAEWTSSEAAVSSAAWCEDAKSVLRAVHREVIAQGRELGVDPAPTTLSLALVRPADDLVLHASVGDSHVFMASQTPADSHVARDIAWATTRKKRCYFAGESYEADDLEEWQWVVGCEPLGDTRAVLLASDGLSEVGIGVEDPEAAAARAVDHAATSKPVLRPLEASRHLTETALEAQRHNQAGDNITVAVIWLAANAASTESPRPSPSGHPRRP